MPSKYFVLSGIVAVAVAVLSCPAAVVAMEQFDGEAPPPPRSMRGQAQDYLHEQYKAYVPEARRQQIHGLQQDLFAAPQNAFKGAKGHFETGLTYLESARDTAAGYAHGAYERVVPQKYREQKASSQPKAERRTFGERLKSLVPEPIRRRWNKRFGKAPVEEPAEPAFDESFPEDEVAHDEPEDLLNEMEVNQPQRRSFGERLKSLVPESIRNKWRKVFGKNKSPSEHVAHPADVHDEFEDDDGMDDVDLMDELAAEEQAEAQGWPTRIRHRVQQFPGDVYDAGYRTAENVYNAMPQRVRQRFPVSSFDERRDHADELAAEEQAEAQGWPTRMRHRVQQFPGDVYDAGYRTAENVYNAMPQRVRERFPVSSFDERREAAHEDEVADDEDFEDLKDEPAAEEPFMDELAAEESFMDEPAAEEPFMDELAEEEQAEAEEVHKQQRRKKKTNKSKRKQKRQAAQRYRRRAHH